MARCWAVNFCCWALAADQMGVVPMRCTAACLQRWCLPLSPPPALSGQRIHPHPQLPDTCRNLPKVSVTAPVGGPLPPWDWPAVVRQLTNQPQSGDEPTRIC